MSFAAVRTPSRASSSKTPEPFRRNDRYDRIDHRASQDDDDDDDDVVEVVRSPLTFASPEIKALSTLRGSELYRDITRPVDVGLALQVRLAKDPPRIRPELEAMRLLDFFIAYVQERELGNLGLDVVNEHASSVSEVIPPWDFVWVDDYIIDPSLKHVREIEPLDKVNGYALTDELVANGGCNCPGDECDPRTCECVRRANRCYPFVDAYYQRMLNGDDGVDKSKPTGDFNFIYDAYGRIHPDVPAGEPIFECNKNCSCSSACHNRVVQKGRKVPLAFHKTESKGWGIKTLQNLKRGTFVGAYGGELLSDLEAERRAEIYERELGTTYLQDVDNHIIKVHLTRQILERKLAESGKLDDYRGSAAKERKMVEYVTRVANLIEFYDEYMKVHVVASGDTELQEAEQRRSDGKPASRQDKDAFRRQRGAALQRARQVAERERQRLRRLDPTKTFPDEYDEDELADPGWRFLSLDDPDLQQEIVVMANERSEMEDELRLTVDSALMGNYTRFFNHSCDPNLLHVPTYIDDASILRPLLAFFTSREVAAGEELCFSYAGEAAAVDQDDLPASSPQSPAKPARRSRTAMHPPAAKPGRDTVAAVTASAQDAARAATTKHKRLEIKCACGAKNCTGRVFF